MIEKIVIFLLEKQKNKGMLNDDAIPIFRYGYTILIEIMLNIIISIIVGVVVGEMGIVLLFNLFFIPLRGFCGGWHAEKSWICTVVSFVSLILVVLVSKYQLMNYYSVLWGFALSISVFVVFLKAPMDSEAKRLSVSELNHYKKIIKIIVSVEVIVLLLFLWLKLVDYAGCVGMGLIIQGISLLVTRQEK